MKEKRTKHHAMIWGMVGAVLVLAIAALVIFVIPLPYKATEACYVMELCPKTEHYTEWVTAKNCDYDLACSCQHHSWWGLGACDSCKCYRTREISGYCSVNQERSVWKYDTAFNMWAGKVKWYYNVGLC